MKVITNW